LALGVGDGTVKLVLLVKCYTDHSLVSAYIRVGKYIIRLIVIGIVLLVLSGVGNIISLGYEFTPLLIVKIVLVAAIFVIGIYIDNAVEPKFVKFAPAAGAPPSAEFLQIQKKFLALEATADSLFYIVLIICTLFFMALI